MKILCKSMQYQDWQGLFVYELLVACRSRVGFLDVWEIQLGPNSQKQCRSINIVDLLYPKWTKKTWNMFNEQQIPVKYDVMLSYLPFPLDWKVLPSSTGAQQERWKSLWTKLDTLATAANHRVFLGVRNHIFTVTRLFVLLFCLFALNHGGIEIKCRWITQRGKHILSHELSSVPQLLQLLVFMEPVKLCQKIWTALPSTGTRKTNININITNQYKYMSHLSLVKFRIFWVFVVLFQFISSWKVTSTSSQVNHIGFIWHLSPVDASLQNLQKRNRS